MKHIYLLFLLLFGYTVWAQNTSFNYKALLTDNGNLIQNQTIDIRFSILENGTTLIYQETHQTITDANGIVVVQIGEGTTTDDFTMIDWENSQYLKVEIDTGSGFQDFGTTAFSAVPYAKYADKAGNIFSGNFTDLSNVPSGLSDGDDDTQLTETQVDNYVSNNGYLTQVDNIRGIPVSNTTPANGQVLKYNGAQFVPADDDVSGGSGTDGVVNSAAFSGTSTKTLTLARSNGLGNITANFTDNDTHLTDANIGAMGYIKNANDADADATNELQTINKVGSTVTLSNGGGSFTDADTHLTETQVDTYVSNNGYLTAEVDGSTTNELQTINKSGSTVTLSNGGGSFTDADTHLTDANISAMGYIKNADDADADATNELQTLSISGSTLSISDGNSVTLPSPSGNDVDFLEVGTGSAPNNIMDNIYHTGNISIGHTNTPTAKMDVLNSGTSTVNNANTGIYIQNSNTSNTNKIGLKTVLEAPTSNANAYAVKNEIIDNGDGNIYGGYSYIGGLNGDGDHYGDYYYMIGDGSGLHTGTKAFMSTNGTAEQIGFDAFINTSTNANTATQIGVNTHITGEGTGDKYGVKNLLDGAANGNLFGTENTISNTSDYPHYGTINRLLGSGSGNHFATSNIITGDGTGKQYGVRNYNSNTGDNTHYGVYSKLNGEGSGMHLGVNNQLQGDGTGEQIGVLNEISNTENGDHYGIKNVLSGNGGGAKYGNHTELSGNGSGAHYGNYTEMSGSGSGTQYGSYYDVNTTGNGLHTGIQANLSGTGTGSQIGLKTDVSNSGNSFHYGIISTLSGTGSGQHTGVYSRLSNTGSGAQYGVKAVVNNTGAGNHYGNYIELTGGTGSKYGTYTTINATNNNGINYGSYTIMSGSGTSAQFGSKTIISNSNDNYHYGNTILLNGNGDGMRYGYYATILGSGTGDKTGVYSTIASNAHGNHYAIYGQALRNTGITYAGYFEGNVEITKKLKAPVSGNADMKAYMYGQVNADGTIVADASSDGFTVTKTGTGRYYINFNTPMPSATCYTVISNIIDDYPGFANPRQRSTNNVYIEVANQNATYKNRNFTFVIYKK